MEPTTGAPNIAARVQRDVNALGIALRRRRRLRLLVRGLWLGLTIVVAGLALRLVGLSVTWPFMLVSAAVVAAAVAIWGWVTHPTLAALTLSYDRHFRFDELLGTGLEVARRLAGSGAAATAVEQRLLLRTLEATSALRRRLDNRPFLPLREIEMLLGLGLVAVALLLAGRWTALPDVSPVALRDLPAPPVTTPENSAQPTEEPIAADEPSMPEPLSPEDQEAADALADALRDSGPGRPAADALDQGDTGGAAAELRELADQASEISPEARGDMAEGLREAAERLRGDQPERAERLDRAAEQIEGEPEQAAAGLDDVARLVDELGEEGPAVAGGEPSEPGEEQAPAAGDGQNQGEGSAGAQGGGGTGSGMGGESRGGSTTPPEAGGEVVPLPPAPETDGPRTSAIGPQGPAVQLEAGGSRNGPAGSAGDAGADAPLEGEADPLRIPPEYRDVVENYFSPPS